MMRQPTTPHATRAERLAAALFWLVALAMAAITLLNLAVIRVFVDTAHVPDTLFILGAAWRSFQGLTPAVDFGYFYGGLLEDAMARLMGVFGPDIFVFDILTLLLTALFAGGSLFVFRERMSPLGIAMLVAVLATLFLTRLPLEFDQAIPRIVSTHSFLYNRVGLAATIIAGLFVALASDRTSRERLDGAVIGVACGLALLVKPGFVLLPPAVLLGLLLQRRWQAALAVALGVAGMVLAFDPDLGRWRAAFAYTQAQIGDERAAQLDYVLLKAMRGLLVQPVAALLALAMLAYVVAARASLGAAAGMLLVAAAGVGFTGAMGAYPSQTALPALILAGLAAAELARRNQLPFRQPMQLGAMVLVAALVLPHALNLAGTVAFGVARRGEMAIANGPFARYIVPSERGPGTMQPLLYRMFADGIAELQRMGVPPTLGIVADHGLSFELALESRPVAGYPLWQRPTAPELASGRPLPPEVDIVMIGRTDDKTYSLRGVLMPKLAADFLPCRTTAHWEIFARRGRVIPGCPTGDTAAGAG